MKPEYITQPDILHRGDRDEKGKIVLRAIWPSHLKPVSEDIVNPFLDYMMSQVRGEASTKKIHFHNMCRFLGCLEVEESVSILDPAVLVSFMVNDLLPIIMRTQVFHAKLNLSLIHI